MKTIPVQKRIQRDFILVDDCHYESLRHLPLKYCGHKCIHVYWIDPVMRRQQSVALANVILNTDGLVDHADRNYLNFQVANLRPCTRSQNQMNHGKRKQSAGHAAKRYSQYRGVHWNEHTGKWRAGVHARGKQFNIGEFDNEVDAAKARDLKASEVHGEFAVLNFPLQTAL